METDCDTFVALLDDGDCGLQPAQLQDEKRRCNSNLDDLFTDGYRYTQIRSYGEKASSKGHFRAGGERSAQEESAMAPGPGPLGRGSTRYSCSSRISASKRSRSETRKTIHRHENISADKWGSACSQSPQPAPAQENQFVDVRICRAGSKTVR
jgi:hypothetical protein